METVQALPAVSIGGSYMKKKMLLLLATLGLTMSGCTEKTFEYTPKHGGLVEPEAQNTPTAGDDDFNDDAVSIYEFYFSYSYSDEPLATVEGPTFKPLGKDKVPEFLLSQSTLVAAGAEKGYAVDPAFPTFVGWSFYGVCLDQDDLWDFTVDHKQLAVIPLYGIWVNK